MSTKKSSNQIFIFVFISILICSLYRVLPFRYPGFAPQIALAFFSGYLFAGNKKTMFLIPIISVFISDVFYFVLHKMGLTSIGEFYGYGQFINYIFIAAIALFGEKALHSKLPLWISKSLLGATAYYLISNTFVWISFGGYARAHSIQGYLECMTEALPFYRNSLAATILFGLGLKFSYEFLIAKNLQQQEATKH